MKVGSNVMPENKYKIEERENGNVAVIFFANIEEIEKDEQKSYSYDMYVLDGIKNQDNLEERIKNDYDTWFNFAKNQEISIKEKEVRNTRDELLTETDWTQVTDSALSEEMKAAYKEYRQALRDVPEQPGFPYEIIWPTKP